ncbi:MULTISPECIES: GNAT family N-acetyltransferase [unclassified Butyrivibrio]|uniref:GNAT family N-acetyltransferase n=1 Tax=unclassified Butyrivibrio TaxID=2639466 RepID=UPI00040E42DB|nr:MULTISPECIES: GNAT family N-acetyltransferase [unclassified Butyrivibrio]
MVRTMKIEDYEQVFELWNSIEGFGIRTIDDSFKGISKFLKRNPDTCVVDVEEGQIVGAILCGHDGRRACFYHVCVREDYRRHHIGKKMVEFCIEKLKEEEICKVALNAFVTNKVGNAFWQRMGWTLRDDMNYYDFALNENNITEFIHK